MRYCSKILSTTFIGCLCLLVLFFIDSCQNPFRRSIALSSTHVLKADSMLVFAQSLIGTPYYYTGINLKTGFDCSGYTMYVYGHFGIKIPHGSVEQMKEGVEVDLCEAQKGDLIVFTGTNKYDRYPGHVGIVLQNDSCKVLFIHSSSNGGVKISPVEQSYLARFLSVRRLNF